ncbi:hypothetical protein PNA2_1230 [Pyrococcus sp. NA2]|uniref:DUF460 domain-containing protein n=1 Tax=Pyrococcus sp. (strain NA2) TaxID=342949 RepID=UPI000209AC5C|nr:DUF460 domain-containing protein [Pyrococcus sp. NA2]AEC52145.1 hypothetical protein PNA2_1230 [Pyrococcus sp. NA2]
MDNINELGEDLKKFLRALPEGTKLVQVTGRPGEQKSLWSLAKEHGIRIGDKFDPYEEAKVAALLASKGVGYEVLAFEDEVLITVTRGRSQGKGGWSQDRYRRRVHNLIQAKVRQIEEALKRADIPFDLELEERDYGVARGEFRVYASREELAGLVRPMRGGDVEVRIRPVERKVLEYVPLKAETAIEERKSIIVGLDPGITVGIAAIDLDGNILTVYSEKNMALSEIVRFISDIGHPVIIATDVSPPPGLVEKIARSFKAQLFVPRESLKVEEKNELLRNLGITVDDDHQRDALAAAYKAYLRYKPKFEHIEARLKEFGLWKKRNEIKALVLSGYSLGEAIMKIKSQERQREEEVSTEKKVEVDIKPYLKRIEELEKEVAELERENAELKAIIEEQRKIIEKLERRLEEFDEKVRFKVLKEREIRARDERIAMLEQKLREEKRKVEILAKKLAQTKKMRRLELSGKVMPLKFLASLTWKEIEDMEKEFGIKKGDVIYVENPAGAGKRIAEYLIQKGIKALISKHQVPSIIAEEFWNKKIPILIEGEDIEIIKLDEFVVVRRGDLEKAIEKKIREFEEEERRKELENVLKVIEEYRIERVKELLKKAEEERQ